MTAGRIKMLRIRSGMTQAELAEKLHITRSNVNAWEHGNAMPSIGMLIKLSSLFGVTTDYLLGLNDNAELIDITYLNEEERKILFRMLGCFQYQAEREERQRKEKERIE